jgi:hypothetical protein
MTAPAVRFVLLSVWSVLMLLRSAAADIAGAIPDASAKAVLPGCRAILASSGTMASPEAAFCSGTVDALLYLGELLPADYRYCVPLDVPRHQVIQAIVREIEEVYPSVEKQLFKGLALEVLHFVWPCRDLD